MIDLNTAKEMLSVVSTMVIAAVGSVFAIKKIVLQWEKNGLEFEKTNAEENIIKILRSETERMFAQNQKLMEQLLSLQLQLGELYNSIGNLKIENDQLHNKIKFLTSELKDLKGT